MFINDNYNLIIIIPTLPLRIDSAVHLHFHLSCMSTLKGFALFGYLSRFPFISSSRLWLFFCYQKQITKFKNSHFILDGLNRGDWKSKDLVFGCYIWPNLPGGPEWDQFEMCSDMIGPYAESSFLKSRTSLKTQSSFRPSLKDRCRDTV